MEHRVRNYIELRLEHYLEDRRWCDANPEKRGEPENVKRTRKVVAAIDEVLQSCDKDDMRIIREVYFRKTKTITGAALSVYLSQREGFRRVNRIINEIAEKIGE